MVVIYYFHLDPPIWRGHDKAVKALILTLKRDDFCLVSGGDVGIGNMVA